MEDGATENEKLQVFSSTDEHEKGSVNNGEERPGGFMKQLISSFTPGGEEIVDEDKQQEEKPIHVESEEKEQEGEKKGGLFTHIMSNLVSSPRARDDDHPKSSGGGIMDNIVSNLPTPLPDDAAPATDEASILIHSIIHD